jgi:uncharacterized protein
MGKTEKAAKPTENKRPLWFGLGFGILFGFLIHKGGATR